MQQPDSVCIARPAFDAVTRHTIADQLREIRTELAAIGAGHIALLRGDDAGLELFGLGRLPSVYPVSWLAERLQLTTTEQAVLWVLISNELCPLARQAIRDLTTEQVADPTRDTLRRIVYGTVPTHAGWQELAPDGTLFRLGLVEARDSGGETPEHRQPLKLSRRVLALVHGEVGLDAALHGLAKLDDSALPLIEIETSPDTVRELATAMSAGTLIVLRGGVGTGRRSLLGAIARDHGHRVLLVEGRAISADRNMAARQLRLVARECALFGLVPHVQHFDALAASGETPDRLDLVERELAGLTLATTTRPVARRWARSPAMIEMPALTGAQRAKLWSRALPQACAGDADLLSTMYPLAPALIDAAAKVAIQQAGGGQMKPEHIERGIRSVLDDRLAGLATRITITQSWQDLILPEEQVTSIIELLARIRERRRVYEDWGFAQKLGKGLGVSALFSGPPGTGKTMCAGLVARDLGTELYQVDLSKIVSKWIGETEKNLAALFDAAEAGHAVLLFDEADALFGKRTEVRSSNDRHANQEVNYLLQRLESFTGICILTTNHETAIDEAFRRRLSVHVRFPMPETEERKLLWQTLIPKSAPVGRDLPFDQLAESYVMSGGYIRNAVLRAAFLAADQNDRITAAYLTRAAQLEYEAMGKVVARH
ncbi:MAG TPA: ATP-binding protein [Kofleriaceae bacterium]|nr:ATP-binding protein [Kofleriaceae bacterium]